MKAAFKSQVRGVLDPLVTFLASARIHPNVLTALGVVFGGVAGYTAAQGRLREAAIWLLVSGLFDMLDGPVARKSGLASRRGAFLDSMLDRYAEGAFLAGLAWYYADRGSPSSVLAVFAVMLGSLLVSYARARSEGLGLECQVGLMERPERLVVLIVGSLIGGPVLPVFLWILAALTHVTAAQRIVHVYRKLES